jgi:transcriptional regulator with GAF, ATPase, and Fis domain
LSIERWRSILENFKRALQTQAGISSGRRMLMPTHDECIEGENIGELAWCALPEENGSEAKRAILARTLAGECVRLVPDVGPEDMVTPVLLQLNNLSDQDYASVQHCSCFGARRLIVVLAPHLSAEPDVGWRLIALGASEVLEWQALLSRPAALAARLRRWREIDEIVASPLVRENLIGVSPTWMAMLRKVVEVARCTTAPVVLLGESGTGKEMLARLIHTLDQRPDKRDLIVLDCTTVVPELSGSEFFGHDRGAFTNAHNTREGAFALADRGTLFLDEVGELPPLLQAQLLRVVQEGTFKRVGSNAWQRTNFRLVCATNRDLWGEVSGGGFRRDLYYRLAGWVFRVPSLRERRDDVLPLARHFLSKAYPELSPEAFGLGVSAYLTRRDYPGNIRDLRQLVLRIGARHVGEGPIGFADIPEDERPEVPLPPLPWPDLEFEQAVGRAVSLGLGLKEISRAASETAVRLAMRSSGSLHNAARCLGVTDRALQMRQAAATTGRIAEVRARLN